MTQPLLKLCQRCFSRLASRHSTQYRCLATLPNNVVSISEEVASALHAGQPVVALETTIITHGMPHPDNLRMALEVEFLVRANGAVPASIGVLQGTLHVGLNKSQLGYLADPATSSVKTSRRDLPYVMSQKLNGGTTVSGTMVAAHLAGIQMFVTGGIGGVHRGAQSSMDISADLTELARTPVTVVSAGVKSILDIGRTLEYLETQGVCVASYGPSRHFPAFFTRHSGCDAPYNVPDVTEAAALVASRQDLGLQTGTLIAVPIPEEHEAHDIEAAIQAALAESLKEKIHGKAVTPYILARVNAITGGSSLNANIQLVKHNAVIGAQIAGELCRIQRSKPGPNTARQGRFPARHHVAPNVSNNSNNNAENTAAKRVVVVGGSIVDMYARLKAAEFELNGATYLGNVEQSFGGVGRNIADALSRLGMSPLFISAIGIDSHTAAFEAYCKHMDLSGVARLADQSTATYCAVLQASGELLFGIGDMDIHTRISPHYMRGYEEELAGAALVCLDGNLTVDAIHWLCDFCHTHHVPVWYEPTDIHKAAKPFLTSAHRAITYSSPNFGELKKMASQISGTDVAITNGTDDLELDSVIAESLPLLATVAEHIPVVLVTLGKHGVILCRHGDRHAKLPTTSTNIKTGDGVVMEHYPAFPDGCPPASIVSVSGAGDCMVAAMVRGIMAGYSAGVCVRAGLLAARLSLASHDTVPATLTTAEISSDRIAQTMAVQPRLLINK